MLALEDYGDWLKHRKSQDLRANLDILTNPARNHEQESWKASGLDDVSLE